MINYELNFLCYSRRSVSPLESFNSDLYTFHVLKSTYKSSEGFQITPLPESFTANNYLVVNVIANPLEIQPEINNQDELFHVKRYIYNPDANTNLISTASYAYFSSLYPKRRIPIISRNVFFILHIVLRKSA